MTPPANSNQTTRPRMDQRPVEPTPSPDNTMKKQTVPRGTTRQSPRAAHSGNTGSCATKSPAKAPSAARAGGRSKRAELPSDPQPGATPPYTIPPPAYFNATPHDILVAASVMREGAAREFLLENLEHHYWWSCNRAHLSSEPQLANWIDLYIRAAKHLGEFSFWHWEQLQQSWNAAAADATHGKFVKAIDVVSCAMRKWKSAQDQRCVCFWLLGRIWHRMENVAPVFEQLVEWVHSFTCQPEGVRDILRWLFHDQEEQAIYDALPDEITVYRGGISPTMWLGFSYTLERRLAAQASRRVDTTFDVEFEAPGQPRIMGRRVPKSAIIGVKNSTPYYADGEMDIVAAPCLGGKPIIGI